MGLLNLEAALISHPRLATKGNRTTPMTAYVYDAHNLSLTQRIEGDPPGEGEPNSIASAVATDGTIIVVQERKLRCVRGGQCGFAGDDVVCARRRNGTRLRVSHSDQNADVFGRKAVGAPGCWSDGRED